MARLVYVISIVLSLSALTMLNSESTAASHIENLNREPFDATSGGIVTALGGNPASPCGPTGSSSNRLEYVRSVQLFMDAENIYNGGIDGVWGSASYQAMQTYQSINNHNVPPVDGCFGRHTADHVQGASSAAHSINHLTADDGSEGGFGYYHYHASQYDPQYRTKKANGFLDERYFVGPTERTFITCELDYSPCFFE